MLKSKGTCLNCGKKLKGRQKYFCSDACCRYYDKHKTLEETESRYYREGIPIREFVCANPDCGKHVYVRDPPGTKEPASAAEDVEKNISSIRRKRNGEPTGSTHWGGILQRSKRQKEMKGGPEPSGSPLISF